MLTDASAVERSLPDWHEKLFAERSLIGRWQIREIDLQTEVSNRFACGRKRNLQIGSPTKTRLLVRHVAFITAEYAGTLTQPMGLQSDLIRRTVKR